MAQRYPEFGGPPPDYLSQSHGEGFVQFFEDRLSRQGIYFMDEPESALSPNQPPTRTALRAEKHPKRRSVASHHGDPFTHSDGHTRRAHP